MTLAEHVAQRIRELRQTHGGTGLSQESLAAGLGVAPNTVSRWETGVYKPALEDLEKLARFLNVSVLEFFPKQEEAEKSGVAALLRATKGLKPQDLEELKRFAEFRKAQMLYKGDRARPGRKQKSAGDV